MTNYDSIYDGIVVIGTSEATAIATPDAVKAFEKLRNSGELEGFIRANREKAWIFIKSLDNAHEILSVGEVVSELADSKDKANQIWDFITQIEDQNHQIAILAADQTIFELCHYGKSRESWDFIQSLDNPNDQIRILSAEKAVSGFCGHVDDLSDEVWKFISRLENPDRQAEILSKAGVVQELAGKGKAHEIWHFLFPRPSLGQIFGLLKNKAEGVEAEDMHVPLNLDNPRHHVKILSAEGAVKGLSDGTQGDIDTELFKFIRGLGDQDKTQILSSRHFVFNCSQSDNYGADNFIHFTLRSMQALAEPYQVIILSAPRAVQGFARSGFANAVWDLIQKMKDPRNQIQILSDTAATDELVRKGVKKEDIIGLKTKLEKVLQSLNQPPILGL